MTGRIRLAATLVSIVAFVVAMAAWKGALTWAVPLMAEDVQKMLGWFAPGFAGGYLFASWRALRLVRRIHGEASAARLNERL